MEPCPVCSEPIKYATRGDRHSVECPRCDHYYITGTALALIKNKELSQRQKANLSGWLSENQVFEITSDNLEWLISIKTPSFHERADKILMALDKNTDYAGKVIKQDKSWLSWGWCLNDKELFEILNYLEKSERISCPSKVIGGDRSYKIMPDGWEYLENIKKLISVANKVLLHCGLMKRCKKFMIWL